MSVITFMLKTAGRMKTLDEFIKIENIVEKINFTNQPVNIQYLFDNFYSNEKENSIYAYLPHHYIVEVKHMTLPNM